MALMIDKFFKSWGSGLTGFYYGFLAKRSVQRSKYMKEDPEQRELFNITTVHKTQKDRIDSFIEAALKEGYVDYIEGWQARRVEKKKYAVSFRYIDHQGNFKYWYWIVDFNEGAIKEITKKAVEIEKFQIKPGENTAFIDLSKLRE